MIKAYVFDPLWNQLVTPEIQHTLEAANIRTVIIEKIAPLSDCRELFQETDDVLLCLNPDYVDWQLAVTDYSKIPNLKAILCASTSVSWIDASYATDHGIPVCNIKNFSTEAVAEWAITMMMNVARQIPELIKQDFPLNFSDDFMKYQGVELRGKKAGIIGLGSIGLAIANRCKGLGMDVVYWSRSKKDVPFQSVELADLLSQSDVVFPVLELNAETKELINNDLLRTMKSSAMLISVTHGLFDESLALQMVQDGDLYGFGFEAPPTSFAKYKGNVWAAPSYAWATDQTMRNSIEKFVDNMLSAAANDYPNKTN